MANQIEKLQQLTEKRSEAQAKVDALVAEIGSICDAIKSGETVAPAKREVTPPNAQRMPEIKKPNPITVKNGPVGLSEADVQCVLEIGQTAGFATIVKQLVDEALLSPEQAENKSVLRQVAALVKRIVAAGYFEASGEKRGTKYTRIN